MTINSLYVVLYTSMFVLPGFIITSIVDILNPPKKIRDSSLLLSYLAYSLVNLAIYSWAFVLIWPLAENDYSLPLFWALLLIINLVGSFLLSVLIGMTKQRRVLYKIAKRLKINVIDPTPTAWDYRLFTPESSFIIITLHDGREIYAYYGSKSFVSSDSEERDIFVEKIYKKAKDSDEWENIPENNGLYISKDMIKLIEFKN